MKRRELWPAWVYAVVAGFLVGLLSVILVTMCTLPAHASHSLSELRAEATTPPAKPCAIPDPQQPDKIVASGYDLVLGVLWRVLDLDGDKRGDYFVEYDIIQVHKGPDIKVRPFPTRYFLDTDGDGYYDKFYHDVKGDGRCDEIVPFQPAEQDPKLPL